MHAGSTAQCGGDQPQRPDDLHHPRRAGYGQVHAKTHAHFEAGTAMGKVVLTA